MAFGNQWGSSGKRCKPVVKQDDWRGCDRKHDDWNDSGSSCDSCGHKPSQCNCHFKSINKPVHLNSDCVLVNSVVCTKTVQKVAEVVLPITVFAGLGALEDLVAVDVVPNLAGVTMNASVIRDKVVNIGVIPATITVTIAGVALPVTLTTSLPFQEHTDCPGACPGDTLTETPLEVEGIFVQPGVPVVGITGVTLVEGILFKIILRTTLTVTRPLIAKSNNLNFDCLQDVNPHRCETTTTPTTIQFPTPPGGGLLGGGGGGGLPTP